MPNRALIRQLERDHGIVLPGATTLYDAAIHSDNAVAMDAQPILFSTANAGIPAYLTNIVDPTVIKILTTANKAAQILGEEKKGDWTKLTASFQIVEPAGEVSSYGDYNNNGTVSSNTSWEFRQSYYFQTITQWGERELAMAGEAQIPFAANLSAASAAVLDKFMNRTYLFGVAGLRNYGLMNDPSLTAPITPNATGTAGGTLWSSKDGQAVYGDITKLYGQLVNQTAGLVDLNSPMLLVMSPLAQVSLTKTNQFNVNVMALLNANFPNLTIETVPEYSTAGGELVQLIVKSIQGQDVGSAAFSEKMRAHGVVKEMSAFKEKKSAGSWGAILKQPLGIAQMLGV